MDISINLTSCTLEDSLFLYYYLPMDVVTRIVE